MYICSAGCQEVYKQGASLVALDRRAGGGSDRSVEESQFICSLQNKHDANIIYEEE